MYAYRCVLHQVTATVDPTTRTVQVTLPRVGLHQGALLHGAAACWLGQVAWQALDDPTAPCGPQGPTRPERGGARCEVVREV